MAQKSILITGCSSGIGLDAARTMQSRGWQVFAACRNPVDCARLQAEGLDSPLIDYEDADSVATGLAGVLDATGGRLDALFNNGAYAVPGPLQDIPRDAMRAIFEANLIGWHDLTRQVIPLMRARGAGRIVQCSSVLGLVGMKWRGAYVATKFALEGLSDVLRMELHGTGVYVSLIEPGPIDTPFRANAVRQFEKWVDWQNSALADDYRSHLLDRLYKGSTGGPQWPASTVTARLIHAVEARRPKPRYHVTTPTGLIGGLRRVLPTWALDNLLRRG